MGTYKCSNGERVIEMWKDIIGYEGMYQISNYGRVKSLPRFYNQWRGGKTPIKGKILKHWAINCGYLNVRLANDGNCKNFSIHRLVATHFLQKIKGKNFVNHKDSDKTNNYYKNLEWCTQKENIKHSYDNKLAKTGSDRTQSKLSRTDVINIKKLYKKNVFGYVEVAKLFDVSPRAIYNLINNKTYKNQ